MYRGSDEFNRLLGMIDEMAELKGKIVLGASWELPCHYGRGETRSQLLAKKNDPTTSATSFAMNYESRWVKYKKRIAQLKSREPVNTGCVYVLMMYMLTVNISAHNGGDDTVSSLSKGRCND